MASKFSSSHQHNAPVSALVVGAGPVGLAVAIELARSGLSVIVLERRSAPSDELGRPQLLVARPADLANLHQLGVDIDDVRVVSPLAHMRSEDASRDRCHIDVVDVISSVPPRVENPWSLAAQRPAALVPIARLQAALAEVALGLGVEIRYKTSATRVRRHARFASIELDGAAPVRAHMVVVATGASRSVASDYGVFGLEERCPPRTLIGGVFARSSTEGQWHRFEHALRGVGTVRCTMLQTQTESRAGTALIAEAPTSRPTLLPRCFAAVAEAHGLGGEMLVPASSFSTQVVSAQARSLAGDNRAPLLVVGDAAQTGHVFAGLTCFANLASALALTESLASSGATTALADARFAEPVLLGALASYERQADEVADVLEQYSRRHYTTGAWAVARAAA